MCLQLFLVLSIPAVALGIPVLLKLPAVLVVLVVAVWRIPFLYNIVQPVLSLVIQSLLSGLRPSGSPKSGAYPWQQVNFEEASNSL